ncbi:MAG: magnesium transporter [Methanomicrobiaceae archaeon]|nr:magnesium transporter [Methanomicrobiaceae archaeon]MDD5419018.1 magnesium transporter [Methanomicrobiaceae archaeon]
MALGIDGQYRLILTGLVTLLISTAAASIAGVYLGAAHELIALIPGLMILLPASIDMRGNISGVLASRLSSSMHLGEFEVDFRKDRVLGDNFRASFIITVLISFLLGVFANAVSRPLGIDVPGIFDLTLISVFSGIISGLLVMAITFLISIASYRYGLDLDMIAAPSVTTAGDLVTLPILILSALFVLQLSPAIRAAMIVAVILLVVASLAYTRLQSFEARRMVSERMILLIPLSLLGILAGATYTLELERLVSFAAFLILIPPYMAGCGSIGGILCSRLATGMHTGEINPLPLPGSDVMHHFIITYFYTLILLPLIAVVAHVAAGLLELDSPGLLSLMSISVLAGMVIMTLVNGVAYITASMSFRYGFDPDNFGIPVITSLIDLIGATVLIAVITLLLS